MELDPAMQFALALMGVFCLYRLALAIYTYVDATGHGSDAMSWMALVSILGLLGFVIWLVLRPKNDVPYYPPGYYYNWPPPGAYYPPPPYQGAAPYAPPPDKSQPAPSPGPPQGPVAYPMPVPYGVPSWYPTQQQYQAPVQYPAPQPYQMPVQYPAPQPYPAPAQYYPPAYYPPGWQPPVTKAPVYNPFAVHRMVATFFAAMAFTIFIELPVMFLVLAFISPDLSDAQNAVAAILTPQMILFAVAVQDAILVYFLYIAMFKPGHLTLKGLGFSLDSRVAQSIIIGTVVGLAMFGLATLVGLGLDRTGLFGTAESPFQTSGALGLSLILISTVLIAPPAEELFFRGYALTVLEKKWGPVAGVVLSAVIFAAAHQSVYQFFAIIPAGIILGLTYRKWGIMPCIAAHAVNNLLAVVLMFLGGS
jgi:hypothetical protein